MIRFVSALNSRRDYRLLKGLYLSAFPANERPPLFFLHMKARAGKCDMHCVYDSAQFVGFTIAVTHGSMVYVFFLAVEESLRSRGYGSAILAHLARKYTGKTLMLSIEPLDEPCDNLSLRQRRKAFYQRNGYQEAGFKICESGVYYEMLSTAPVRYADYQALMTAFLGKALFHMVHRQAKK